MTTIVYSKGILAADTQLTQGDCIVSHSTKKLFKVKSFSHIYYIGIAGDPSDYLAITEWAKADFDPEFTPKTEGSTAIIVDAEGNTYGFQGGNLFPTGKGDQAVGSGYIVALGALAMGASAVEAVKAAGKIDVYTNTKVKKLIVLKDK